MNKERYPRLNRAGMTICMVFRLESRWIGIS